MSILLGLGSNIGDRLFYLQESLLELQATNLIQVQALSSVYLTEPEELEHEKTPGCFLNLACQIETELQPEKLLEVCLKIENKLGRSRKNFTKKKSSRKIDIDLLYFRDLCIQSEELTIPHPRIRERAFVIFPLAEIIDKNWKDPLDQLSIQTIKKNLLSTQNKLIQRLDSLNFDLRDSNLICNGN